MRGRVWKLFHEFRNEIEYTLPFELLPTEFESQINSLIEKLPELDIKPLPDHLKYAYLGDNETFIVMISTTLSLDQETSLLSTLSKNREAIGWSIAYFKGISSALVQHRIHLIYNAKPVHDARKGFIQKRKMRCVMKFLNFLTTESFTQSLIVHGLAQFTLYRKSLG